MSIHEELVAKTLMAKPTTDEEWLNIDWNTRLITIPSSLTNIGVYNDKDTNRLYFRCPIEYGEFKIADFGIRVNYQNTGVSETKYDGDVYFVDDVENDGEYLTFSWLVGRHAYLEQGTTAFVVCCKVVDGDGNIVNELNTTLASLAVLEGLEIDVALSEDYPDYLEAIIKRCEEALKKDARIVTGTIEEGNHGKFKTDGCAIGLFSLVDGGRMDECIFTHNVCLAIYSEDATVTAYQEEVLCVYPSSGAMNYTVIGATLVD